MNMKGGASTPFTAAIPSFMSELSGEPIASGWKLLGFGVGRTVEG